MPQVVEGHSHSISIEYVRDLTDKNPKEAFKLMDLWLLMREGNYPPMRPIYQKGWSDRD